MASEYGWAKRDILNDVYLDELFYLNERINERQLGDYRVRLAIAQNPYTKNPKELWNIFNRAETKKVSDQFDPVGFDRLKQALRKNPRFEVK